MLSHLKIYCSREYYLKGLAPEVNVYDFIDKEKGKVSPYGIYDLSRDNGWVVTER